MALNDPMQSRVQRTIFHAIRKQLVTMGYLPDRFLYPDNTTGDTQFETAKQAIKASKGFYVDIFGQSSQRNKYNKECPRIVVFLHRIFEGEVGQAPGPTFELSSGKYVSKLLPSMSSNLVFAIHLLSNRTNQDIVLNAAIANALGQRKHLKFYDDLNSEKYIYTYQSAYNDLEDPGENILERVFNYTVTDIVLTEDEILGTNITPIQKITVNMDIKPDAADEMEVINTP